MVQKYTKKPVTIEAIQWTEENLDAALTWIPSEVIGIRILGMEDSSDSLQWTTEHYIKTLEGDMKITEGDYVIKGVKGEFYPCKPDIFYATYDGPTRVLWDHNTGEYDKEYFKQNSIDAGIFLADLLTKELEELGDEDLEPREDIKLEEGVEMFKIGGETDEEKAYRMGWLNGYDEGVYDGENK